jgi:HEAT repeat protein
MPLAQQHWSEHTRGLTSPQPATRVRAARELGKLGAEALGALPELIKAVEDSDQGVREAAVQAIALLGPAGVVPLVQFLSHSDKYVRRNATWGLGKLGQHARSAMASLCAALHDSDPRTASGAAQALGNLGASAAAAVPALTEAMRGTNVVLCRLAAKALSQIGPAALPTLLVHLKHHDPFVRGEAAVAVGWIGPAAAAAVPALLEMVRAGTPSGRPVPSPAAYGGSGIGTPIAMGQEQEPGGAEDTSRLAAITALGRIGAAATEAVPVLASVAAEPLEQARTAAEVALRQIRGI